MTAMIIPVTATIATAMIFQERFYWNLMTESTFENGLNNAYIKVAHCRKNLLMLPSGAAGRRYVKEVTCLMELRIQDATLKSISLKAVYVMLA